VIENTVYQILSNITPLTNIIDSKIYYENNPNESETEYLIYQKSAHVRPLDIQGSQGIQNADFQIDIYSNSEDSTRNIASVLVENLHGTSNNQYSDNVQQIYVDSEFSSFDSDSDAYRIALTISVYF
jgi:hypothetical protein